MNLPYLARQFVLFSGLFTSLFVPPLLAHSELLQTTPIEKWPPGVPAPLRTDIVRSDKNMSAPILIHSIEPRWPAAAPKPSSPVTVFVNCYVERDGTTSNVHAVRVTVSSENDINYAAKSMEDSAVETVKHYKFKPAKKRWAACRCRAKHCRCFSLIPHTTGSHVHVHFRQAELRLIPLRCTLLRSLRLHRRPRSMAQHSEISGSPGHVRLHRSRRSPAPGSLRSQTPGAIHQRGDAPISAAHASRQSTTYSVRRASIG
jgi:hypothetical protein